MPSAIGVMPVCSLASRWPWCHPPWPVSDPLCPMGTGAIHHGMSTWCPAPHSASEPNALPARRIRHRTNSTPGAGGTPARLRAGLCLRPAGSAACAFGDWCDAGLLVGIPVAVVPSIAFGQRAECRSCPSVSSANEADTRCRRDACFVTERIRHRVEPIRLPGCRWDACTGGGHVQDFGSCRLRKKNRTGWRIRFLAWPVTRRSESLNKHKSSPEECCADTLQPFIFVPKIPADTHHHHSCAGNQTGLFTT